MTATAKQNRKGRPVEVGSIVGVRMGATIKRARVIEDRGNIGVGGRRIVRVELEPDPEVSGGEPFRFERPVERLLDPPA
ncbi:MAG: hypothetical protein ACYCUM_11325 [Solirubrobacteraceae bacterium]